MRSMKIIILMLFAVSLSMDYSAPAFAQQSSDLVIVKPKLFDGVLVNPDIGFTTFQRFNGDSLNAGTGWTEGFPIKYQPIPWNAANQGLSDDLHRLLPCLLAVCGARAGSLQLGNVR